LSDVFIKKEAGGGGEEGGVTFFVFASHERESCGGFKSFTVVWGGEW